MAESSAGVVPQPLKVMPKVGLGGLLKRIKNSEQERRDMYSHLRDLHLQYGNVVSHSVLFFKMVNLFGPDANRFVLLDRDQIFSARRPWMAIMGRIFPNGLLLMDGQQHKTDRKIMHLGFKRPVLREYAERMNSMVEAGIENWFEPDKPFLVFPAIKSLTLDMASSIFVGIDLGPGNAKMNEAFENLVAASMSRIRLPIPGLEFQRGLAGRKFMVNFFRGLIDEKRKGDGSDLLSRLTRAVTEEGERFEDQQIIDHMTFLMMAAHDTTTSTLSSMIYELAKHPEWQERVREECIAHGKSSLAYDELDQLEILSYVMKETLRLYPPLPIIPRIAEEEFEYEGYRVSKGAMVVVSAIHTHRMPEWWDDPDEFDPLRFAPGRAEQDRHTHSWIPFGGGPHMCIGLRFAETQIKTVIHHLVRRYRWTVPEGYVMPVQQAPISKPLDGLPVRLEPTGEPATGRKLHFALAARRAP